MDPENTKIPAEPEAPPAIEQDDVMAAMNAGIAAAGDKAPEEPEEEHPEEPAPEAAADEAPEGEEQPEAAPEEEQPEPDAVEDEIAELKLGERSAKRFRELSESEKALAPIRKAAEEAGVDLAEMPAIFQRAKERDEFVEMVQSTGASPEQFGKTLDYLTDIHAAANGDMQAAERAFGALLPEVQALAQLLGKDVAGIADPLAGHDDLKEAVESGDITRAHALELARGRTREKIETGRRAETTEQARAQQEREQGRDWLNRFDAHMGANDPTYVAKRPQLLAFVETIGASLPPAKWPEAVQQFYARIPSPAVPPPKPRPGPVRSHIPPAKMDLVAFDDPAEAMEAGIRAASGM